MMHLLATCLTLSLFAGTALASASTVVVTMSAPPAPTSTSYTSDQGFQNDILAATNFYRSEHGVAPVTWNATSAKHALNWSSKCNFEHSVSPLSFQPSHLLTLHSWKQVANSSTGRTNRRKPRSRLRKRQRISRRLGSRTGALQLGQAGVQRGYGTFHSTDMG